MDRQMSDERRKDYPEIVTDIAVIKERVKGIEKILNNDMRHLVKSLDNHKKGDRWMFAIIFSFLTTITTGIILISINLFRQ